MFGFGAGRGEHRATASAMYGNPFEDGSSDEPSYGHRARGGDGASKTRPSRGNSGGGGGVGTNPFDDDDGHARGADRYGRGHGEKPSAGRTGGRLSRGGSDGTPLAPSGKNPFDDDHQECPPQNRKAGNGRQSEGGAYGASRTPPPARPAANPFGDDSDEEVLPTRKGKSTTAARKGAMRSDPRSRTPPPSSYSSAGDDHENRGEKADGGRRRYFPERKQRDISSGKSAAEPGGRVPGIRTSRVSEPGVKAHRSELMEYTEGRRKASDPGSLPGSQMGGGGFGHDWTEDEEMKMREMGDTSRTIERCQQIANETLGIAAGTLDTLQKQGEQIQRTHEAAVRVDQELSKGEQLLGSLGPMFGWRWKPKKTKDITGPAYHASEGSHHAKGAAENRAALGLGKSKQKDGDGRGKARGDSWSQHGVGALGAYEEEKAKQDDALGDLSNVVAQLKDMSTTMGQEMERQNGAIDHLTSDMEELDNRVKGANERGRRLLRR